MVTELSNLTEASTFFEARRVMRQFPFMSIAVLDLSLYHYLRLEGTKEGGYRLFALWKVLRVSAVTRIRCHTFYLFILNT